MFQKLKDKLAEEVKQSSLKFPVSVQQLTQAVSSSTSPNKLNSEPSKEKENEDVFNESSSGFDAVSDFNSELDSSFTNIDLRSPTPNRNRRSSTSSDLFPIYEFLPTRHNLQSDLESNSEFDDGSSIHQCTNVSKEILYEKYRNMLQKYHKYRGRCVDMRKYCLELEREHEKIKNVLTETQDKAIRRTKELKEQCSLEQKAKAHLEGVLRNELEERDLIISTLNTKIKLLKSGKDNISVDESSKSLVDFSKNQAGSDQVHFTNSFKEVELLKAKVEADVFSSSEKSSTDEIRAKDEEIRSLKNELLQLKAAKNGELREETLIELDHPNGVANVEGEGSHKNVAKIEEYQRQIEAQKSLLSETQNELASKDMEIVQLKQIRTRLENDVSNLRREVSEMKDDLSEQSQIRDEISTLNKSLCQMRDALSEKDEQLKSHLETIGKLRSELSAANTKLTDSSKYQKMYEEALTHSKADKIVAEEMMKNVKNELNASQVELKNAKIAIEKFESESKAKEQMVEEKRELEEQLAKYKSNLAEVTVSLEQARKVEREMNVQTANFLEEINKLKSKEDEYLDDIRKLKEDLSSLQNLDKEVRHLNVIIEESRQESRKLSTDNEALKVENTSFKERIDELHGCITQLEQSFLAKKKSLEAEQKLLEDDRRKYTSLVVDQSKFDEEIANLKLENAGIVRNNEEMSEKIGELVAENRSLLNEIELLKENKTSLLNEIELLKENKTSLLSEIELLKENKTSSLNEMELLKENELYVNSQIEILKQCDEMKEFSDERMILAAVPEKFVQHSAKIEELRRENESLKSEVAETKVLVEELQNRCQKFETLVSEKEKLEEKLSEERSKLEELHSQFAEVQNELEAVQRQKVENEKMISDLEEKLASAAQTSKVSNDEVLKVSTLPDLSAETCSKSVVGDLETAAETVHTLPASWMSAILLIRSQLLELKAKNAEVKTELLEFCKISTDHFADDDISLAHLMNVVEDCETENQSIHGEVLLLRKEKVDLLRKIENLEKEIEDFKVAATENLHNRESFYKEKYSQEMMEIITGYEKRLAEKDNEYESLHNKMNLRNDRENTAMYQETKEVIQNLQEELTTRQDSYSELLVKHRNEVEPSNATSEINSKGSEEFLEDSAKHSEDSEALKKQVQVLSNELNNCKRSHWREIDLNLMNASFENAHQSNLTLEDFTEMEYLRNVLFKYMMGHQPLVLAKVLAAVVKFDNQQTEQILLREEQKQTLMGHFGFT